jgi:hypothetical protein
LIQHGLFGIVSQGVRLACNDLDLDSAQELLAFLESQPSNGGGYDGCSFDC